MGGIEGEGLGKGHFMTPFFLTGVCSGVVLGRGGSCLLKQVDGGSTVVWGLRGVSFRNLLCLLMTGLLWWSCSGLICLYVSVLLVSCSLLLTLSVENRSQSDRRRTETTGLTMRLPFKITSS